MKKVESKPTDAKIVSKKQYDKISEKIFKKVLTNYKNVI